MLDFHLNQSELISLRLTLRTVLEVDGIFFLDGDFTSESRRNFHPNSHIGKLVSLYRRVLRASRGHAQYNAREQTSSEKTTC